MFPLWSERLPHRGSRDIRHKPFDFLVLFLNFAGVILGGDYSRTSQRTRVAGLAS